MWNEPSFEANPAKAGDAKPRVLASSATPDADATKDPKTAELLEWKLGVCLWEVHEGLHTCGVDRVRSVDGRRRAAAIPDTGIQGA